MLASRWWRHYGQGAMLRRRWHRGVAVSAVAAVALVMWPAFVADASNGVSQKLRDAVTLRGLLGNSRALQQIADVSGGFRAAGTTGHAASAGYVLGQLTAAGYDVQLQQFEFPFFQETATPVFAQVAPNPTAYLPDADFSTMTYSGSGDVTGPVQAVDVTLPPTPTPSSGSGCEAADFAGFTAGSVALVQRGTCTFQAKAENAQAAGATAVVVFNEGQPGRTEVLQGTLGAPTIGIPVVGTSFAVGAALSAGGATVHLKVSAIAEVRTTVNVIAETKGGRSDNVVMLGAHLDSVTQGPGINDNASGSAALIEVAKGVAKTIKHPNNKVRFAWWSAEEFNLLGSAHYLSQLTESQRGDIALYLNFDMIASPNWARLIYDGDDSDGVGAGPGPTGSAAIESLFTGYFAARHQPTEGTDFDGRSDYGPFIDNGIPSGGIFTGAQDVKTPEQAAKWGGTAGVAFDPCYHQACDTTGNLSTTAFIQNADAIAHATAVYAFDTSSVNGRTNRVASAELSAQTHPAGAIGDNVQ